MTERNLDTPWREILIEKVSVYYRPEDKTHGLGHAKDVEKLSLEIAQEPEYKDMDLDLGVLKAMSLLHDTGYSQQKSHWQEDKREHIEASVRIAAEILPQIPGFSDNQERMTRVLWGVLNHDNKNYLFPSKGRGGVPALTREHVEESEGRFSDESTKALLDILNEADSRLATGTYGAKRTLNFNLKQEVPLFSRGDPLRGWMWGESAVGSVRLAAKRALLDAKTKVGKEFARKGYLEAEELIKKECLRSGIEYTPELDLDELEKYQNKEIEGELEIVRIHPWEELEGKLRQVSLKGDSTLFPYVASSIESRLFKLDDVSPLSYYTLSRQLDLTERLRELFLKEYALDLFDLSGIVEFRLNGQNHKISPPLVELSKPDGNTDLLVDGGHRWSVARRLGKDQVRCIYISGIPEKFPLIPLPLEWSSVAVLDEVPEEGQKRDFRFPTLESFPDISGYSDVKVDNTNFRYYFYRDLSPFGSSGVREAGKKE